MNAFGKLLKRQPIVAGNPGKTLQKISETDQIFLKTENLPKTEPPASPGAIPKP